MTCQRGVRVAWGACRSSGEQDTRQAEVDKAQQVLARAPARPWGSGVSHAQHDTYRAVTSAEHPVTKKWSGAETRADSNDDEGPLWPLAALGLVRSHQTSVPLAQRTLPDTAKSRN